MHDDLNYDPANREEHLPPPKRTREVFISPTYGFINVWTKENGKSVCRSYCKTPSNIRRANCLQRPEPEPTLAEQIAEQKRYIIRLQGKLCEANQRYQELMAKFATEEIIP